MNEESYESQQLCLEYDSVVTSCFLNQDVLVFHDSIGLQLVLNVSSSSSLFLSSSKRAAKERLFRKQRTE